MSSALMCNDCAASVSVFYYHESMFQFLRAGFDRASHNYLKPGPCRCQYQRVWQCSAPNKLQDISASWIAVFMSHDMAASCRHRMKGLSRQPERVPQDTARCTSALMFLLLLLFDYWAVVSHRLLKESMNGTTE